MKVISEVYVLKSIKQARDVTRIGLSIVILRCVGTLSSTINLLFVMFAYHIDWGHLVKERIFSHKGKLCPLRAGAFF